MAANLQICHDFCVRLHKKKKMEWFKTSVKDGKQQVYDPIRKRYVALTPEEQVRQHTLKLLVEQVQVPTGLIAVEYSIKVNNLDKRCDIVVFDKTGSPLIIVECKAAHVKISEKTLDQAVRYHSALKPRYIILTNGISLFCLFVTANGIEPLSEIPSYTAMTEGNNP